MILNGFVVMLLNVANCVTSESGSRRGVASQVYEMQSPGYSSMTVRTLRTPFRTIYSMYTSAYARTARPPRMTHRISTPLFRRMPGNALRNPAVRPILGDNSDYFPNPAMLRTTVYDQFDFLGRVSGIQVGRAEMGSTDMTNDINRCAKFDEKAGECFLNGCYYCCSDTYCHPNKQAAPDCFHNCGACKAAEDCFRNDCLYSTQRNACEKKPYCEQLGSNRAACLQAGCFFCCQTSTCHTSNPTNLDCNKGCKAFCFEETLCRYNKCNYIATSGQCLQNSEAVACDYANDLIVVADESGSVGSESYKLELQFSAELLKTWRFNIQNRIGFMTYECKFNEILFLNNTLLKTPNEVYNAVIGAYYHRGGTCTGMAIDVATKSHKNNPSKLPKHIVVITDGTSDGKPTVPDAVQSAREANIYTFSVGVGSSANKTELLQIANYNGKRVFEIKDYANLKMHLLDLSKAICEASREHYEMN